MDVATSQFNLSKTNLNAQTRVMNLKDTPLIALIQQQNLIVLDHTASIAEALEVSRNKMYTFTQMHC